MTPTYRHGNIVIANGRLQIDKESLPLVNIQGVTEKQVHRPRRHWMPVMILAAVLLLTGVRFSTTRPGWVLMLIGMLLGLWGWFFHRDRVWVVRLHLLLNQRIGVLFEEAADAREFVAALKTAKGGKLGTVQPR